MFSERERNLALQIAFSLESQHDFTFRFFWIPCLCPGTVFGSFLDPFGDSFWRAFGALHALTWIVFAWCSMTSCGLKCHFLGADSFLSHYILCCSIWFYLLAFLWLYLTLLHQNSTCFIWFNLAQLDCIPFPVMSFDVIIWHLICFGFTNLQVTSYDLTKFPWLRLHIH